MLVARLPSLVRGAAVGPIAVTDSSDGDEIGTAAGDAGALGACAEGYPDCGPEGYLGCGLDGYPDCGPAG
jgi:hypothetical protein